MEAAEDHGFRPSASFTTSSGVPVLDVRPLRAISPFPATPRPLFMSANLHSFGFVSPRPQYVNKDFSGYPTFDPAEVRRKLERDIALRAKQQPKSAPVRDFLVKREVGGDRNQVGGDINGLFNATGGMVNERYQVCSQSIQAGNVRNHASRVKNENGPDSVLDDNQPRFRCPIGVLNHEYNQACCDKNLAGSGLNGADGKNFQAGNSRGENFRGGNSQKEYPLMKKHSENFYADNGRYEFSLKNGQSENLCAGNSQNEFPLKFAQSDNFCAGNSQCEFPLKSEQSGNLCAGNGQNEFPLKNGRSENFCTGSGRNEFPSKNGQSEKSRAGNSQNEFPSKNGYGENFCAGNNHNEFPSKNGHGENFYTGSNQNEFPSKNGHGENFYTSSNQNEFPSKNGHGENFCVGNNQTEFPSKNGHGHGENFCVGNNQSEFPSKNGHDENFYAGNIQNDVPLKNLHSPVLRQIPMKFNLNTTPVGSLVSKANTQLAIPKNEHFNPGEIIPKANIQLAIPKTEHINPEEFTPKANIQLAIPKTEYFNRGEFTPPAKIRGENMNLEYLSRAERTPEAKTHDGNATGLMDLCNLNTQEQNTKDLRSAFARSLKRFKDLTVLEPGSTLQVYNNTLEGTQTGTRKRKRSAKGTAIYRATPEDNISAANERKLVRKTRMIYDALRRNLAKEDETGKEPGSRRPDLKAGALMMDKGLWINRDRRIIGSVPGVYVGDQFYFRMELCVIGLHGQIQAGIDYITAKTNQLNEPLAISIIASGGYEDNEDAGDVLIYTGQGGNNYKLDKKQTVDQKLERGNLALERSMHHGVEIRVIRGIKDGSSPSGKIYTYDGLYKIQDSWLDTGRSGCGVFKYKLQRTPGQPELGSAILKSTCKWRSQPSSRSGLLHPDISSGREKLPVCLVNDIDDDRGPTYFEYTSKLRYSNSIAKLESSEGCDCTRGCSPLDGCSCTLRNGGEMPYNQSGILIKGKPLIYECGDRCRCPPSCRNRVSQQGPKNRLEVFKTSGRGWGVRSWDSIAPGSFICEYTGELISGAEGALRLEENEYLLNAKHFHERWREWDGFTDILSDHNLQVVPCRGPSPLSFMIDAAKMGNVARFMNHSCSPNVTMQFVLYDHHDIRFPHIMLFAMEHIPPLTELTFDYGSHEDGKCKICLCGASDCKGIFS